MRSNGQPYMTTEKKRKDAARKARKRAAESGNEAKERKRKNAERDAKRRQEESEAETAKQRSANAQKNETLRVYRAVSG